MRASAILCTLIAGTFGFATLAPAQPARVERQQDRQIERQQRQLERQRDMLERQEQQLQRQRQLDRAERRNHDTAPYAGRRWSNVQENCERYWNCETRSAPPRYYRGGYLPRGYLQPNYYVSNWYAYQGLYAPPPGYQWVNVGSDYVLVSLSNGLIANVLVR